MCVRAEMTMKCVCGIVHMHVNPLLDRKPENRNIRTFACRLAIVHVCVCVQAPHSRDDQRGGEEQRPQQAPTAVGVLPLALVHLAAAVVAAAAEAEEEADDGHQGGEEQPHRRAHQEAHLVVDGLGSSEAEAEAGVGEGGG